MDKLDNSIATLAQNDKSLSDAIRILIEMIKDLETRIEILEANVFTEEE